MIIDVPLGKRSYPIHVGTGLLTRQSPAFSAVAPPRNTLIVTDTNVGPLYADALRGRLLELGGSVAVCTIPAGEEHKTLRTVEMIWDAALGFGADRSLCIAALGGGVVGDLAGFAASSVLRGVAFWQIPTSLLAMVDSAVGGKTGFNRPTGKNLIGAFKQPQVVIADIGLLQTLDPRQLRAGLAEALKHGVVLDEALVDFMEQRSQRLLSLDEGVVAQVVGRCCQIKASVVAEDERERGKRRVLNFGHTIGHALERTLGYGTLLHGEAVAIGMALALRIGVLLGRTDPSMPARLDKILASLQLPRVWPGNVSVDVVAAAVVHDKKRVGDDVAFVCAPAWGRFEIVDIALSDFPTLLQSAVDAARSSADA